MSAAFCKILNLLYVNVLRGFAEKHIYPWTSLFCSFLDRTDGRLIDAVMFADAATVFGMIGNCKFKS